MKPPKIVLLIFLFFVSIFAYSQKNTDIEKQAQQMAQDIIREVSNISNRAIKKYALSAANSTDMYLYAFDSQALFVSKSKCEDCVKEIHSNIENYVSNYVKNYCKKIGLDIDDKLYNETYNGLVNKYTNEHKLQCNKINNPNYNIGSSQATTKDDSNTEQQQNKDIYATKIPSQPPTNIPGSNNNVIRKDIKQGLRSYEEDEKDDNKGSKIILDETKIREIVIKSIIDNTPVQLCELIVQTFVDMYGYNPNLNGSMFRQNDDYKLREIENACISEANKICEGIEKEWEQHLNIPNWNDIYKSINNPQRFISLLTLTANTKSKELPEPFASDKDNYYMYIDNNIISVSKNGQNITITPSGDKNEILRLDRAKFLNPNDENSYSINENLNNSSLKYASTEYSLKEDGSCSRISASSTRNYGTKIHDNFEINREKYDAPKLAVKNKDSFYFQTEKSGYYFSFDFSFGSPVGFIKEEDGKMKYYLDLVVFNASVTPPDNSAAVSTGVLGLDIEIEDSNDSVKAGIGGGVSAGFASFGGKIGAMYSDIDIMPILDKLPVNMKKDLYNSFLQNNNMIDKNYYEIEEVRYYGAVTHKFVKKRLTDNEFNFVKEKFIKENENAKTNNKVEINKLELEKTEIKGCS